MSATQLAALLAAGMLLVATEGAAGIYKCTGPDGTTIFTSEPSVCPGAKPHVLKKQVQSVLGGHNRRALQRRSQPAARRLRGPANRDGIERMWRSKRSNAEGELQRAEQQLARVRQFTKFCNRGGELYRKGTSGIRKHVSCAKLHEEAVEARQQRDELVHYLAEGLEDECRRAGCQPGWVR